MQWTQLAEQEECKNSMASAAMEFCELLYNSDQNYFSVTQKKMIFLGNH